MPTVVPELALLDESRLEREFWAFHYANPHVYALLVQLCRQGVATGRKRLGIGMLWEVLRWNFTLQTTDDSGFKLNDHHRSRYARLIMAQEPDLAGIFEIRPLRS